MRDPRMRPEPTDKIESGHWTLTVTAIDGKRVHYHAETKGIVSGHENHKGASTLAAWRQWCKAFGAKVIYVAPEVKGG